MNRRSAKLALVPARQRHPAGNVPSPQVAPRVRPGSSSTVIVSTEQYSSLVVLCRKLAAEPEPWAGIGQFRCDRPWCSRR